MISIVTPSFGQIDWLKLAIASVGDQQGVAVEHIIQDGGTPNVQEAFETVSRRFTREGYCPRLFVETDSGMYDAINRGLRRASGDIVAYLNCDEQYLPQALARMITEFRENPNADILIAGSIVVDQNGGYICSRPGLPPSLSQLRGGRMYNLTCSIFFRASLLQEQNLFFDSSLRVIGDLDWLRRVIEAGKKAATVDLQTSVSADTGTNLALSEEAVTESLKAHSGHPALQMLKSKGLVVWHRFQRLLAGHYNLHPFDYAIYTRDNEHVRKTFHVSNPTGVWRNRL